MVLICGWWFVLGLVLGMIVGAFLTMKIGDNDE